MYPNQYTMRLDFKKPPPRSQCTFHQGKTTHRVVLLEYESIIHGEDEVNEMARQIKICGYYPYLTTPPVAEGLYFKYLSNQRMI